MKIFEGYSPNMKAAIFAAIIGYPISFYMVYYQSWKAGYDVGARDITRVESYKTDLEKMIGDLHTIGTSVHQTAEMIAENTLLKDQVQRMTASNEELKKQLKIQGEDLVKNKKQADEYANQIAQYFSNDTLPVTVAVSHAETTLGGALLIGVASIFGDNSFIDANISAASSSTGGSMKAGDTKTLKVGDRNCTVRLMAIDKPNTTFSVICLKS